MSYTDQDAPADNPMLDLHALANPQEMYKMLRDMTPVMEMEGMVLVAGEEEVREVLKHPEVFSSGVDAVHIGQIRPLIPLQIDPPEHKNYRKLLDPLFAPKQVALLEDRTRELVRGLHRRGRRQRRVQLPSRGRRAVAHHRLPRAARSPGVPPGRVHRPQGRDHPPRCPPTPTSGPKAVDATGAQIYAVLARGARTSGSKNRRTTS